MRKLLNKIPDLSVRKGLFISILEGSTWSIMFGAAENYIVPLALLFGASVLQTSLLQGLGQLGIGIGQLAGGKFISGYKKRRNLSIICNVFHALSWLLVFFLTFWTKSPWFVVLFYFIGITATSFASPGWISWMNDLIPQRFRGEFWGKRNLIVGTVQFTMIISAGVLLYFAKKNGFEVAAYGVLFTIAFLARISGTFLLKKQYEPPMKVTEESNTFKFTIFLKKMAMNNFGRFVLFSIFINFTINLVNPLIPVYLFQQLHFNYIQFMILITASTAAQIVFMTYWGPLSDRYGNYIILLITSLSLPLIAVGWIFIQNFYALLLLQLFSGFVLGGLLLCTNNFIFDAVRPENMSRVMSYFNTLNTFFAFSGAIVAGLISSAMQKSGLHLLFLNAFTAVFALSALLRILVWVFYRRGFQEVRKTEKAPAAHHFYTSMPLEYMMNFIVRINRRIVKRVRTLGR